MTEPDALLIQDPTLLHHAGILDGLRPDGYVLVNFSRGVADLGLAEFAGPGGPGDYEIDYDYCKGCGICAAECPCGAIAMVPEEP